MHAVTFQKPSVDFLTYACGLDFTVSFVPCRFTFAGIDFANLGPVRVSLLNFPFLSRLCLAKGTPGIRLV